MKANDENGRGFLYLKEKFPKICDGEIKERTFVGPQITELIKDETFDGGLNDLEKRA